MHCYKTSRILAPSAVAAFAMVNSNRPFLTQSESSSPVMNDTLDRWKKKWDSGMTKWHQPVVYWALKKYGENYITDQSRVLVPLCGKTVDLAYLSTKAKEVVGVEGVMKGVEEFIQENPELQIKSVDEKNNFHSFCGGHKSNLWMFCGDFFHFGPTVAGKYDLIWDRAAMVAIDPSKREEYVQVLGSVLKPGGVLLLSGYIRPKNDVTTGPPFTLNKEQVTKLFEDQPWVASLECIESASDAFSNLTWYKRLALRWRFGGAMGEDIWVIRTKEV